MYETVMALLHDGWPRWRGTFPTAPRVLPNQTPIAADVVWSNLERELVELVFGSNMIEHAGTTFDITLKLCQAVFRGQPVPEKINEHSEDYQLGLEDLRTRNSKAGKQDVFRSRREVMNHAKAFSFLIEDFVAEDATLHVNLILQCHKILCEGEVDEEGKSFGGVYRTHECAVRYGEREKGKKPWQFIRARAIPEYMDQMVKDFNADILCAEKKGKVDPYLLAARYHHRFVNIHPFGDGNGRMSRMLLNSILLKYTGHATAFGGTEEEAKEYLAVVHRGGKIFYKEDGDVVSDQQKGHEELTRFVMKKSEEQLRRQ